MRAIISATLLQRSKVLFRKSDSFTQGGWGKYWFDFLVLVVALLIGAGLWRDAHFPINQVVAKGGGIEPFHVIELSDLRITCQSSILPSSNLAAELVGRYSTEYLESCAPIDPKRLSSGPRLSTELKDRILLELKVHATSLFNGMHPPFRAALMGSPRAPATTALLVNDLIVLNMQKDGDGLSVVVAAPYADEATLASFAARSDLFLVMHVR
jgi:hypothetical protein